MNAYQLDRTVDWGVTRPDFPLCRPSLDDAHFESLLLRLHSAIDVASLWSNVQSIIEKVAPCDAYVIYLKYVDYSTTWNAARILMTANARKPRSWLQSRRETDFMPAFILANPGLKLYQLCDVEPDTRKLHRSEFFRRYMAAEGWHYTACALFWNEGRLHSEIALRRTAEQGDFTAQEMALLDRLHPHIETTLQRLVAVEALAAGRPDLYRPTWRATEPGLQPSFACLTRAERDIVRLLRVGSSNKEIAAQLEKSIRTVKTQLTSVYKKFGVRSRSQFLARMI